MFFRALSFLYFLKFNLKSIVCSALLKVKMIEVPALNILNGELFGAGYIFSFVVFCQIMS